MIVRSGSARAKKLDNLVISNYKLKKLFFSCHGLVALSSLVNCDLGPDTTGRLGIISLLSRGCLLLLGLRWE